MNKQLISNICLFHQQVFIFQNTKKTWHPSTFKNQERVWKAEQAAAEEKKRILELERERAQERDREELNELSKPKSKDDRLHWMYDVSNNIKICQYFSHVHLINVLYNR